MGVLNGDHRFVDVVDVIAGRHASYEIAIQTVGRRETSFERCVHSTGQHGVRDVNV